MNHNARSIPVISHRLRGFDIHDATVSGLKNALNCKIQGFEIDTRFTRDGEIVIHHDPFIMNERGVPIYICDCTLEELQKTLRDEKHRAPVTTLCEILDVFQENGTGNEKIYLDIKEFGKEKEIIDLFKSYNMLAYLIIISWLPEVLIAAHELNPEIKLGFSHYPLVPGSYFLNTFLQWQFAAGIKKEANKNTPHKMYYRIDAYNPPEVKTDDNTFRAGDDYEHLVSSPMHGILQAILKKSKGFVCCNYHYVNKKLVDIYHENGIEMMVYSVNYPYKIDKFINRIGVDSILTDEPLLCN